MTQHPTNPNNVTKSNNQAKIHNPTAKPKRTITNNPAAPANLNKRTN